MTVVRTYDEFDSLVVGHGIAGLSTAISLLENGNRPVVVEKSPRTDRGGNTRFMSAIMRIPIEDPELAKAELGLEWTPGAYPADALYDDVMATADGRADPDRCRDLADGAYDAARWLADQGLQFGPPSHTWDVDEDPGVIEVDGGGSAIVETLASRVADLGGEFHYETAFRDLDVDERNRVTGGVAVSAEGRVRYSVADTVICSGGYLSSSERRARYMDAGADTVLVIGTRYNTGEPLQAAVDCGASTSRNVGRVHLLPADGTAPPTVDGGAGVRGYEYGVLLNDHGQRFVDEGRGTFQSTWGAIGTAVHAQPRQRAYLVYDDSVDEDRVWSHFGGEPVVADTVGEVLRAADVPNPDVAERTVEAFNDATGDGEHDPDVLDGVSTSGLTPEKSNWAVAIDTPPFRCFPIRSGTTFVYGGLETTVDGTVVDTRGRRLGGLWAAGNATGGIIYEDHFGPIAAISATRTGVLAGRAISSATER